MSSPVTIDMSNVVTGAATALSTGLPSYVLAGVGILASLLALRFGLRLFRSFVK